MDAASFDYIAGIKLDWNIYPESCQSLHRLQAIIRTDRAGNLHEPNYSPARCPCVFPLSALSAPIQADTLVSKQKASLFVCSPRKTLCEAAQPGSDTLLFQFVWRMQPFIQAMAGSSMAQSGNNERTRLRKRMVLYLHLAVELPTTRTELPLWLTELRVNSSLTEAPIARLSQTVSI